MGGPHCAKARAAQPRSRCSPEGRALPSAACDLLRHRVQFKAAAPGQCASQPPLGPLAGNAAAGVISGRCGGPCQRRELTGPSSSPRPSIHEAAGGAFAAGPRPANLAPVRGGPAGPVPERLRFEAGGAVVSWAVPRAGRVRPVAPKSLLTCACRCNSFSVQAGLAAVATPRPAATVLREHRLRRVAIQGRARHALAWGSQRGRATQGRR